MPVFAVYVSAPVPLYESPVSVSVSVSVSMSMLKHAGIGKRRCVRE